MTPSGISLKNLNEALAGIPLQRAMEILSAATRATVVLFDAQGNVLLGPAPGSAYIERLLGTERGRALLLAAHQSAALKTPAPAEAGPLAEDPFYYFAAPLVKAGQYVATMTLGDRPRRPIDPILTERLASASGASPATLQEAADLPPWSPAEAAAAERLLLLTAELLATIGSQDEDLRHRIEELTAVYNIVGLLAGTRDTQEILNRAARMVCAVMHVKACSIRMLDEETGLLNIRAVYNLSSEYLNKGPVLVSENSIDAAAMQGVMVHIADAPNDPRTRYPEEARKEGIVSGLICGLIFRGKAVGVVRVYTDEPHHFTPFEESLLRAVAAQAAALVVNARLLNETLEAERYAQQLAYAGQVQRRMIPAAPPQCTQVDIGAVYRPIFEVGGDYYDFLPFAEGDFGLAIADVSGKGVPASLLMASLRSALRGHAYHTYDLDRILCEVNDHFSRDTSPGEFATMFYGVLSRDRSRLTYCNAGHDPPMLLRNGQIQYLDKGGLALGIDPQAVFSRAVVEVKQRDVLLLYTDGAVEAMNFAEEQFGRERLAESFKRYTEQNAQQIANNILWDIRRFRGLADRSDDLTLVVLKIK